MSEKKKWYEEPLYVWHLDYYLPGNSPDAFRCFDAERIADEICAAGPTLVVVFALNQHGYAYYPSKVAPPHPHLKGLDYTGELISALRRRNKKVFTYVNYMNIELREKHPDWWQRYSDGSIIVEEGWGVPCPNGPVREYMKEIFHEIAERYDTDGFFFDMFGFNRGGCYCESCKAKFRNRYGLHLPEDKKWDTKEWREFVKFRYESALEAATEMRDAAKSAKPDIAWITHTSPLQSWASATGAHLSPVVDDIVHTEVEKQYGKYRWAPGEMGKLLLAYSGGKPCIVNLADLHVYWEKPKGWFYIPDSATELKLCTSEIVANGCWPSIYTEPYPDSRHNPYTNEGMKECFTFIRNFEPYLVDTDTVKSVALHFSRSSYDFFGKDDPNSYLHSFRGMYRALLESHIPFDIVFDEQILDGRVKAYDLLVMSNSACTSVEINTAVEEYVARGGSLLITYKTSLYDEEGRNRPDFGLAGIIGANYAGDFIPGYMVAHPTLCHGLTSSPILEHRLVEIATCGDDSKTLGWMILHSPTDLAPFTYVSAPSRPSDQPVLIERGRVMYCAGDIGYSFMKAGYPDHRQLVENIVKRLLGPKLPIRVNAPTTLDMVLREQGNRLLIHLVNLTTNQLVEDEGCSSDIYDVIPLHNIDIKLSFNDISRVYKASDGEPLLHEADSTGVRFRIPEIGIYEIIVCERAPKT